MVCLESAILEAPSVFTHRIVNIGLSSGFTNTRQDYWNSDNTSFTVARLIDQTNWFPVKRILRNTLNSSMADVDEVAKFLCDFILKTKAFRCYLGSYYLDEKGTITYITQSGDI